eukprot:54729_1
MSEILLHEYNYSKYARRINSKRKQNQKLRFKHQQIKRWNKIKYKSNIQIRNKRSLRKIQQKQWSKENKRTNSKPKHDSFHIIKYERFCDETDDDSFYFINDEWKYPYETLLELNELTIFDPYTRDRYNYFLQHHNDSCECIMNDIIYEPLRLVKHLMTETLITNKHFQKEYQKTCLLFNMQSFSGHCSYLYYIMTKLGIIQQLFHTKILQKIDIHFKPNLCYYKELVNIIIFSNKLNNNYLQCIWDDINSKVDSYLNADNHKYYYNYIMLDKTKIINIINDHSVVTIGYDICSLITEFTMYATIAGNLLYSLFGTMYANKDAEIIDLYQYNIEGHTIIDYELRYRCRTCKGKIYDGYDISKTYEKCKKHYFKNALFHHGQFDVTFNTVLVLTWYKFKRYYMEKFAFHRVGCKMLYALILYFVRHRKVCRHVSWQLNIDS